ncbi:MAG: glutaredoxin [Candidatus Thermoplasmatota archaeon]|nr:glutaredoxin [Candidatus Thermoplasmatota archaeon]MBU1941100.1 glutaredoxin [Candidatus Thermoplasmatota archaeon]
MRTTKVPGTNNNHSVLVFTLSTCGWCRKTKELLKDLNVQYEYIDLDQIDSIEQTTTRAELKKYNPRCSLPTLVIDNGKLVIIGYKDHEIREVFN